MKRRYWLLLLVFAVLLNGSPILADGDFYVVSVGGGVGTKITSLPYTIKSPGFYYLGGNLTLLSGPGITINTNDVTLDLMGFNLNGTLTPGGLQNYGIYMSGWKNVEIRNGSLVGWDYGIRAESRYDIRIINVRTKNNREGISLIGYNNLVKGCTSSGNLFRGITVEGSATVNGNMINDNGLAGVNKAGGIWLGGGL